MKMDYQFLMGRDFCVGTDVYTVRDIAWQEEFPVVQADVNDHARERRARHSFPLAQVLQWLLVEEEIELFNPNFLGAAGS
jgi:hypothetical protein